MFTLFCLKVCISDYLFKKKTKEGNNNRKKELWKKKTENFCMKVKHARRNSDISVKYIYSLYLLIIIFRYLKKDITKHLYLIYRKQNILSYIM